MKTTGVIRRIDELGRIVIPKEIRRNLGIRDGESIEIFIDDNSIILKKHSRLANTSDIIEKLGTLTHDIMNYNIIITDREKVILSYGNLVENLKNKIISPKLIDLIDLRETLSDNQETTIDLEDNKLVGFFSIVPIISSTDSLGLIIIYSKNKLSNDEIKYSKLFAKLIGEKIDIA